MLYIVSILVLLIIVSCLVFFVNYSKLKEYKNSIDISASCINDLLMKKHDLICNILKSIADKKLTKSFSYDEQASLFEKEDNLFNINFEIIKFIKNSNEKKFSDDLRIISSLDENIDGLKDYYNAYVLNYNEIFLKKYFTRLFSFLKFSKEKPFRIRKLEEYEIFKN